MRFPAWLVFALLVPCSQVFAHPSRASDTKSVTPRTADSTREPASVALAPSYGDFDGDGLVDVYSVDALAGDRLLRNRGDGEYFDVTEQVGLAGQRGTRMALWHDFDGNGTLDLYVCAIDGQSHLFRNGGSGFTDVTASAGVAHEAERELFAEWIDCDGDELSDLHVVTARGDRLFRNAGRGHFGEVDFATPSGRSALRALAGATVFAASSSMASSGMIAGCPEGIADQANPGTCIPASSDPRLGMLMPLSRIFSISGANVGIRTASPTAPLDIALGDKSFQIRRDGNLVPGINLTGTGGNVGILRLRNSLEVWPDDTQSRAGYLDVRGYDNSPRIQLDGGSAQATFTLGDKILQIRNDGNLVPGINLTGTGGNLGILRLRNSLEIWPDDAQTSAGRFDVRDVTGASRCALWGDSGDAWFLGNVGIGTSAPVNKLDVAGGISVDSADSNTGGIAGALRFGGAASGEGILSKRDPGGNQYGLDFYAGTAVRMTLTQSGNLGVGRFPSSNRLEIEGDVSKSTAGSWLANSDRRIKTDVHEIDGALATLDRIRPVAFHYDAEYVARHPAIEDKEYYNVIAQEFAEVFPEYVKDSGEDGILQVDTYPALVHAIAAVKELHGIVHEKESRIASLEERLARLESSVATLSAMVERR